MKERDGKYKGNNCKNCKNCTSLITMKITEENEKILRRECALTFHGFAVLPNCPCQKCMIKIVCHERCDELQHAVNKFMNRWAIEKLWV